MMRWTTTGAWLFGLLGSAVLALNVSAEQVTGAGFRHGSARLMQGEGSGGVWSAGLEIRLAEGWKTYWRMPGDSGVPPHFDWSGSVNLDHVEVHWPAPGRYRDAAGETVGYADTVVFPLTVRAEDPQRPVELTLDLSYAVCNDICIPATVTLHSVLEETAMMPAGAGLIRRFEALVPGAEAAGLKLGAVEVSAGAGGALLAVELIGTAADEAADIFVETDEYWYFGAPEPVGRTGESLRFHLPIEGSGDAGTLRGQTLKLTVVTATARLTREVTVD